MTDQKITNSKNIRILIPLFGGILFIIIYIIAAFLYPGGSQADKASKGFSWLHNYWCNLLNERAINNEYNPARPVAITGMFILCISLATFWYLFASIIRFGKFSKIAIQFSGIISMCAGFFLFTRYHDIIINIACLLAVFALIGTFSGLYKMGWRKLFWFGIINLALIGINNLLYYNKNWIAYLPVVQKITFLSFLLWICLIDIGLYKHGNHNQLINK